MVMLRGGRSGRPEWSAGACDGQSWGGAKVRQVLGKILH